jgi:3-phenylpropionate/trans-cinnamate dioxygenase ferredoxin subunit
MTENKYIDIAGVDDIPEGYARVFEIHNRPIAICRLGEEVYAINATCTHDNFRFEDGPVVDCEIECPRHGARFDVRSGEVRRMPAIMPVETYPARLDSGRILISIEED